MTPLVDLYLYVDDDGIKDMLMDSNCNKDKPGTFFWVYNASNFVQTQMFVVVHCSNGQKLWLFY